MCWERCLAVFSLRGLGRWIVGVWAPVETPKNLTDWAYGIQRRTHRCLHCTDMGQPTGRHLPIHLTTIPDTHCECGRMCVQLGVREKGWESGSVLCSSGRKCRSLLLLVKTLQFSYQHCMNTVAAVKSKTHSPFFVCLFREQMRMTTLTAQTSSQYTISP